jgi:hypothetical protein
MTKKKNPEDLLKVGRPSKYTPDICQKMIKFFDVPHIIKVEKEIRNADGTISYKEIERPNSLPTFERFAFNIGVIDDTLRRWANEYPEFCTTYKRCQHLQKDMINDLGMLGLYNAHYTKFVAMNITDMKDTSRQELTGANGAPIVTANATISKDDLKKYADEVVDFLS